MSHTGSFRRTIIAVAMVATVIVGLVSSAPAAGAASQSCKKMSGQVLLTYHNPDMIIMGTGKGMNIATVFTMTQTTTYTRNGLSATLDGIRIGDMGYISFQAAYPSGALLACSVVMTGP